MVNTLLIIGLEKLVHIWRGGFDGSFEEAFCDEEVCTIARTVQSSSAVEAVYVEIEVFLVAVNIVTKLDQP